MVQGSGNLEALVERFGSLADATRLRLLRLLERNELGVVELCDVLQLKQSTVSNHLKVLLDQAWLKNRRQGTTNLYTMVLDELEPHARKLWLLAREQTDHGATAEQDQLRLRRLLSAREGDSRTFFAGAAGQWDKLRVELYGESFINEALLALLPNDAVIADLGCGTGRFACDLARHVGKVVGVDNSPAMLKAAQTRAKNLPRVQLIRADLQSLPMASHTFDACMLLLVLTYLPDPSSALREAARILKPAGKMIIVDLLPHDRDDFRRQMGQASLGFGRAAILDLLNDCGHASVTFELLPPPSQAKGPALFLATSQV